MRGGRYDRLRTVCTHEDIDYIDKYRGMTKEQVDAAIMPLLRLVRPVSPTPATAR